MTRLFAAAVASFVAIGCTGGVAPTAAPTHVPSTPSATTAPTPVLPRTEAPSLPSGVIDGGSGWGASASALANGTVARFTCPPAGEEYAIWGTAVYTSDSSVCTAAVHSGLLSFASGGDAIVQVIEGQDSYIGSTQNGVTSRDYGSYSASFAFDAPTNVPSPGNNLPTPPGSFDAPPSSSLTGDAAALLLHVPPAIQGECMQVTSFDGGVIVAIQCINIPNVDGYVTYYQFDNSENLQDSWFGNYDFYGDSEGGSDCAVGPSLVAHMRGGIAEGRLFCNAAPELGSEELISYWFDEGLLIQAGMVTSGYTYADNYALYLTAGPTE